MEPTEYQDIFAAGQDSGPTTTVPVSEGVSPTDRVVYLDDIKTRYPGARFIKQDDLFVEYSKDNDGEILLPLRVPRNTGRALEVVCVTDLSPPMESLLPSPLIGARHALLRSWDHRAELQSILDNSSSSSSSNNPNIRNGSAASFREQVNEHWESIKRNYEDAVELTTQMEAALGRDVMEGRSKEERAAIERQMNLVQRKEMDTVKEIHREAKETLSRTFEFDENSTPWLFTILPKEDWTADKKKIKNPLDNFRLHFLCECGEHTKPPYDERRSKNARLGGSSSSSGGSGGSGSSGIIQHHCVHRVAHEGYGLVRPDEFLRKFGIHMLRVLRVIKYGGSANGITVMPLASNSFSLNATSAEANDHLFRRQIDESIQFLESALDQDKVDGSSTSSTTRLTEASYQEVTEEADFHHLSKFLVRTEDSKTLGNLFRMVTRHGHVKWVCREHYYARYRESSIDQIRGFTGITNYNEEKGRVEVNLFSSVDASNFYTILQSSRFVHELCISMQWESTYEDVLKLQTAIDRSSVVHLELDCCDKKTPMLDKTHSYKRADPIWEMMGRKRLRSVVLKNVYRLARHTTPGKRVEINLSSLDLTGQVVGKQFLKEKIVALPPLKTLKIQVPPEYKDLEAAFQDLKMKFPMIANLTIRSRLPRDDSEVTVHRSNTNSEHSNSITLSLRLRGSDDSKSSQPKDNSMFINTKFVHKLVYLGRDGIEKQVLGNIFQNYMYLQSLELECPASRFLEVLKRVQEGSKKRTHFQQLKLVDTQGENTLVTDNIHDNMAAFVFLSVSIKGPGGNGANPEWLTHQGTYGFKIRTLELAGQLSESQTETLQKLFKDEAPHQSGPGKLSWWHIVGRHGPEAHDVMSKLVRRSQTLPATQNNSADSLPGYYRLMLFVGDETIRIPSSGNTPYMFGSRNNSSVGSSPTPSISVTPPASRNTRAAPRPVLGEVARGFHSTVSLPSQRQQNGVPSALRTSISALQLPTAGTLPPAEEEILSRSIAVPPSPSSSIAATVGSSASSIAPSSIPPSIQTISTPRSLSITPPSPTEASSRTSTTGSSSTSPSSTESSSPTSATAATADFSSSSRHSNSSPPTTMAPVPRAAAPAASSASPIKTGSAGSFNGPPVTTATATSPTSTCAAIAIEDITTHSSIHVNGSDPI
ncbi:hypothetical protein B0O80DRAFT_274991 [Mortierella sp. GBAus27b]|nr:hypothetical protein B0O80DRAFT_274991 [Mortierella sp. GBAus27b]